MLTIFALAAKTEHATNYHRSAAWGEAGPENDLDIWCRWNLGAAYRTMALPPPKWYYAPVGLDDSDSKFLNRIAIVIKSYSDS